MVLLVTRRRTGSAGGRSREKVTVSRPVGSKNIWTNFSFSPNLRKYFPGSSFAGGLKFLSLEAPQKFSLNFDTGLVSH